MGTSLQVARRALARLGERGRTTAIPAEVRQVLVAYALEQRERGRSWAAIAEALGVSSSGLIRWSQRGVTLAKGPVHAREGPQIQLAHCWSHVRRKFLEAEPHYPEAGWMLERIGELYRIEREIREAEVTDRLAYARERRRDPSPRSHRAVALRHPGDPHRKELDASSNRVSTRSH